MGERIIGMLILETESHDEVLIWMEMLPNKTERGQGRRAERD